MDLQLPKATSQPDLFSLYSCDNHDISQGAEWQVHNDAHTIILHHQGVLTNLSTELDGHGKSFGLANAGEIWIIPAQSKYYASGKGNRISYSVLRINPDSIANTGTLKGLHGVWDPLYYQAVNQLLDYQDSSDSSQLMRASIELSISEHIQQHYCDAPQRQQRKNPRQLTKSLSKSLQKYIYDNLANHITLEDLAGFTDMTTHQLLIAFRQAFLTSPAQYIIEQRLRLAQWQLINSNLAITDIAYQSGFASHSHLSTTFKKKFNCTPSQFRTKYNRNS